MALGLVLFVGLYWLVPTLLEHRLDTASSATVRAIMGDWVIRRNHLFRGLGIALGLICAFFAVRNYLGARRLGRAQAGRVGFLASVLARWLN